MKPIGFVSVLLVSLAAYLAYFVLQDKGQQQQQEEGVRYDLGSGRMFDTIAPRYDIINKVISLGLDMRWRRAMIEGLELRPGDRVVDMATGTADVAIMLSQDLAQLEALSGREATKGTPPPPLPPVVVGIDPSPMMLNVGRKKTEEAGLSSRVRLEIGDAQDLASIPDGSVDKLTMAFGIRNVPDRLKALKEFRRIMAVPTRPTVVSNTDAATVSKADKGSSSVVAILELQDPETGVLSFASRAFIRYAAPVLGWFMSGGSGAEYGHLKNSILQFPSVEEWTALMAEAGLDVFEHQTMGFGTVHLYLARPQVAAAATTAAAAAAAIDS